MFLAAESLGVGQDVSPEIVRQEIAKSDLVVIACGNLTARSPFVVDEVEQSLAQRREGRTHILPIILKAGVTLPGGIDYSVQAIHRHVLFPELRWIPIGIAAALVLATAFSLIYFERARQATDRESEQAAHRLWSSAATERERDDSLLAAHLMAEAADLDARRPSWENAALAAQTLLSGPRLVAVLEHDGGVEGATLDRGERWILTWSEDGTVRLWDAAALVPIGTPMAAGGPVLGATFDCREERILSWNCDGSVRLWNVASQRLIGAPMISHVVDLQNPVFDDSGRGIPQTGAMFSRNCSRILTWGPDGTARVWDAATLHPIAVPMKHWPPVLGATFDADEHRILTWGNDATVTLWDASTQRPIGLPMKHTSLVRAASFGDDGTVRVWDAATQHVIDPVIPRPIAGQSGWRAAAFDPTERYILTWSWFGSCVPAEPQSSRGGPDTGEVEAAPSISQDSEAISSDSP